MIGAPGEGYERYRNELLPDYTVVIVERLKFDYKTGAPKDSEYFRGVTLKCRTVSGPVLRIYNEPDVEFPAIAGWSLGWIYANNDAVTRIWRKR